MKLDGYRMLCRDRERRGAHVLAQRQGLDRQLRRRSRARAARLPVDTAWLDGEVVVMEADGRTSFQALQNALDGATMPRSCTTSSSICCTSTATTCGSVPLVERKRLLESAAGTRAGDAALQRSHRGLGRGVLQAGVQAQARRHHLQARAVDLSVGGRCRDWLKVKCSMRQEMVIGGFTDPEGSRTRLRRAAARRLRARRHAALFGQSRHRLQRGDA